VRGFRHASPILVGSDDDSERRHMSRHDKRPTQWADFLKHEAWAGKCFRLDVKLIDGTMHSANFKFTK